MTSVLLFTPVDNLCLITFNKAMRLKKTALTVKLGVLVAEYKQTPSVEQR